MVATEQVRSLLQLADALMRLPAVLRGKAAGDEIEELYKVLREYEFPISREELKEQKNIKEALYQIMTRPIENKQVLSLANKELQDEGLKPVESLTGYGILEIVKELRRKMYCLQKCDPENCPYGGMIYKLIHTPNGIFAIHRICSPFYKRMIIRDIEDLAGRKISQIMEKYGRLEDLDFKTLKEIREALRKTRRREE